MRPVQSQSIPGSDSTGTKWTFAGAQPGHRHGVRMLGWHPKGSDDRTLAGVIEEQEARPRIGEKELCPCELMRLLSGFCQRYDLLLQPVIRTDNAGYHTLHAERPRDKPARWCKGVGVHPGTPGADTVARVFPIVRLAPMARTKKRTSTPEHVRLEQARTGQAPWKAWGPYLSERQWGTVREDYSEDGDAWNYFTHDQARSRAYRWGEDGIAGICDERQRLCLALALWNGADPILKERMFGLSNGEGNHGEDVKEYWFYLDSTPTHSYLKCQYKYPQRPFPYLDLVTTNGRRNKQDMEYELLDTGVFEGDRYFDVVVEYAKASPEDMLMLVTAHNRGPDPAPLHVLPTLWFRNTWSWGDDVPKPTIAAVSDGLARADDHELGEWLLSRRWLGVAAVL